MTDRERFLKLATWSLWGQQKKIVRMELEAHIEHKVWKYQMRGFSQTEALEKTLADLGQPHVISAGMTGVYAMPNLLRKAGLMILLSSLGISALNAGAQVTGTARIPIQPCLESKKDKVMLGELKIACNNSSDFFLSLNHLKADLIPKGVKFEQNFYPGVDKNGNKVPSFISIIFPTGKPASIIQGGSTGFGTTWFDYSQNYIDADRFLTVTLPKTDLPISLTGWDKPLVSVGQTQFEISFDQSTSKPEQLYGSIVSHLLLERYGKQRYGVGIVYSDAASGGFTPSDASYQKKIQFNANSNTVYILLGLEKSSDHTAVFARVFRIENNSFSVISQLKNLKFVNSWDKLKPVVLGGITPQRSGTAILARINTKLNNFNQILEIIDPRELRVLKNPERLIAKNTTQSQFCQDKGGVNTMLAGRWIGEFISTSNQGKVIRGRINTKVQWNGVFESALTGRQVQIEGYSVGAFCENNSFLLGTEHYLPKYQVQSAAGSIRQLSDNLLEGSSIERDEQNKVIGRTYFRMRRQ